ncbi:hypothetical protein SBRCBS47491_008729 [Sporothrix bragantina]|uniref:Aldehyde dehydrogenase domain-containing protein n=1 Tax=Sporothrix bragantina TaxID=671064 RepID=A0ABP0CNX5_9PEZI
MDNSPSSGKAMPYYRLRAAAIDGRATNIYFRRNQLRRLNNELLAKKTELMTAIVNDSGNTNAEALAEFYLTLSALNTYFGGLDPQDELQNEYRIANGKDAVDARQAVGIAYIEPATHSYLYSVVVPIAAAVAAGNCVLVVIEQTLKTLPGLLQSLLKKALDPETVEIAPSKVHDKGFLDAYVQVIQTGRPDNISPPILYSQPDGLAIGVVDRTANMEEAAKALVAARFSFGGTSCYAPDVVLVNEHVKTGFLNAAIQHSIQYLTKDSGSPSETTRRFEKKDRKSSEESDVVQVITSGSNGEILFVKDRAILLKLRKIRRKALYVHSVTSMDDAINLADSLSAEAPPALATYVFGAPASCKYLSQFIASHATFVNHIPREMLIGPAAPMHIPVSPSVRYPVNAFTTPRPAFFNKSTVTHELEGILADGSRQAILQKQLELMKKLEVPPDRPVKQMIGFFEQGILVGLGTVATPILLALGTAGYLGVTRVLLPKVRG